jgi:hypothetical protein
MTGVAAVLLSMSMARPVQARQASAPQAPASSPAPASWTDRLSIRGYAQFRLSRATTPDVGPTLEVPADRSVLPNESFIIRRGRVILSGDVSSRMFLYAQVDLNGVPGAGDYAVQMRDLYADIALTADRAWRVRVGQSKVPYGWVNMQSSQNRLPMERADALNSAVEGERDYGAYLMWASPAARRRFRELVNLGLKGSGDYGVAAIGVFNGQGLNRADQNGQLHQMARVSYPFRLRSGQYMEMSMQAYQGRFVSAVGALAAPGGSVTPIRPDEGVEDARVAGTFVWYPQPFGLEAEWTVGRGPELSDDLRTIEARRLQGGYVQATWRRAFGQGHLQPFARWHYYEGGRKFARNAPRNHVNELDLGIEVARWRDVETVVSYTRTFARSRTSAFPYDLSQRAHRVGVQVQWNY